MRIPSSLRGLNALPIAKFVSGFNDLCNETETNGISALKKVGMKVNYGKIICNHTQKNRRAVYCTFGSMSINGTKTP